MPDEVAVFAAETGSAQAHVTVLRRCLLAHTAIVAGILSAGLAVRDSHAVSLIADQIDLLLPEHQSAYAADETGVIFDFRVDSIVTGDPAHVEGLFQVQSLASANRDHFVRAFAVHQHRPLLPIALDFDSMPLAQGDGLVCANNSWPGAEIESVGGGIVKTRKSFNSFVALLAS